MNIEIQADVWGILLVTIVLTILIILVSKKLEKTNPLEKPKGLVAFVLWACTAVNNQVVGNVGKKEAKWLTPYILTIWIYIFFSNISGLFGIASPTANYSVTLLLAFITWVMIQVAIFRYQGVGAYFHSFIEPIPVMLPMNIFGKFSTMISMSLRLFGNIMCGGVMMQLVYSFTQWMSNSIAGWFGSEGNVFNFMGPVVAPLLHAYFDVFAGFMQTLVFVTLTMVFIGNEMPEEIKEKD